MSTTSNTFSAIGLLCLALLSLPGSAQPTASPLGPKGLNWVLPFVGDWKCYQQGEANGSGGGGSGTGANLTYSIKITKDNVTLDSTQPSPLLTAHSVITYDAEKEIFNYTYSDSGGNSGPGTSVGWEEGGVSIHHLAPDQSRQTRYPGSNNGWLPATHRPWSIYRQVLREPRWWQHLAAGRSTRLHPCPQLPLRRHELLHKIPIWRTIRLGWRRSKSVRQPPRYLMLAIRCLVIDLSTVTSLLCEYQTMERY